MIGIYKITSPSGKVYIGQSVNIIKRFYAYRSISTKQQPILHRSFIKYGVENHKFEVIEECEVDFLNERERYWQEHYEAIGKNGLNCMYVNTNEKRAVISQYTIEKHKFYSGKNHPSWGKKRTPEQKERMSIAQKKIKRKPMSEETKKKLSLLRIGDKNPFYGKKNSPEVIKRIREANIGRKKSEYELQILRKPKSLEVRKKMSENHRLSLVILDLKTGIFYDSISELCKIKGYNTSTISRKLKGQLKNNTSYVIA